MKLVVIMGVAGSGKSTVGRRLARELGVEFVDADDLHTDAAKERMHQGLPLDDAMRRPWLDRLHALLAAHEGTGVVAACSALKHSYRDELTGDLPDVVFLCLVAPRAVLESRLEHRKGHFAGPNLLDSQLATLELGDDMTVLDATRSVDDLVAAARAAAT
ncbi:MAG TPA: gluconokinase, GntK/IdnK-type [Acidimicrobiia bacterium]|jgi:carbohydrate kinase (thermoresistant glucokinase family)